MVPAAMPAMEPARPQPPRMPDISSYQPPAMNPQMMSPYMSVNMGAMGYYNPYMTGYPGMRPPAFPMYPMNPNMMPGMRPSMPMTNPSVSMMAK